MGSLRLIFHKMRLFLLVHFFTIQGTAGEKESPDKCFPTCPNTSGWEEREDRCYLWPGWQKSWTEAEKFCNVKDSHLASVSNLETHKYIWSKVDPKNAPKFFWIGGREAEGKWSWTDGSAWDFEKWATSPEQQPDDDTDGENCLQIYHSTAEDGWNDQDCESVFQFVCSQRKCQNDTVNNSNNNNNNNSTSTSTIAVAAIASIIAVVVTLAIVSAALLLRRYWKEKNMVKIDHNNDYGYYYSPEGDHLDERRVEMVDTNDYYQ